MKEWGFSFGAHHKNVYMDGHERDDVVSYRESFIERMRSRESKMSFFEGEEMKEEEPLLDEGEGKLFSLLTMSRPFMPMMPVKECG